MDLPELLKKVIKGEVSTDVALLEKNSRDASVFKMTPAVVVCPASVEDLQNLVKFVNEHEGVSLTVRAAGTDMSGGPLTDSICVSFTEHFNRIIEIGKEFAIVEPGVMYRDLEKATLEKGLLFPSFPASKNICAIGGMVMNNAGGEKSLSYGKTIRYVEEVKMVLSDGAEHGFAPMKLEGLEGRSGFEKEIYQAVFRLLSTDYSKIQEHRPKVSKNSTGYQIWDVWNPETKVFDLTKLFVGSQGTLGILTEVKLGLVPVKNSRKLMVLFLKDFAKIPEVVQTVLSHQPTAFECFDDYTTKLAKEYFADLLAIVAKHYTDAPHEFTPELLSEAEKSKLVLLVEFEEDSNAEVENKIQRLADGLKPIGVEFKTISDPVEREVWWAVRHESFNLLRQRVKGKYAAPFIDDLTVLPQFLPEFLPKLYEILNKSKMTFTVAGHIGDGNFHIFPLMDMSSKIERDEIYSVGKECFDLTVKYGGSISGEHNDGLVRAPFVEEQFGPEIYDIFKQIKQIFDPKGIFNPRKKIGIDKEYSERFLMTSS